MTIDIDTFVAIPLPTALVAAMLKRSPYGVSSLIETVMTDFLERTEADFSAPTSPVGLYWDALFLPNGTLVRTKYKNEVKVASVENQAIIWQGEEYSSFAQLSNAMRGNTMTNAWRELEIKRPTDKAWQKAQALRR